MPSEEVIDPLLSPPRSQETSEEISRNEMVTEPFGESNEGTSTQQATTAFPEEPVSSVDQTNVGLLDPTVSAASSLTPLGEGAPGGENFGTISGLGDSLGPTTIPVPAPQSRNMAAGSPRLVLQPLPIERAVAVAAPLPALRSLSPPIEDYPGQFGFDLEFEQSGTAESVTYTESNEGTSTQQATTAFPEEPGSSVDQTNVGLLDPTVSAASSLTPLGEGALEGENLSTEKSRLLAEKSRLSAENSHLLAENSRLLAENSRLLAENNCLSAEKSCLSAEKSRLSAENSRLSAEKSCLSAEISRLLAEKSRLSAEESRLSAEESRLLEN